MRIEQCKYLLQIKDSGSINKAADKIFISHQALSKSMKMLEEEFNCQIIDDVAYKAHLTPDGEKIAAFAEFFLQEYAGLKQDLHSDDIQNLKTELKIYASLVPYQALLPNIIEEISARLPYVSIEFKRLKRQEIDGLLAKNNEHKNMIFLLSKRDELPLVDSSDYWQSIKTDISLAVMSKKHHLAHKKQVSMRDLSKEMLAIYQYDDIFELPLMQYMHSHDLKPNIMLNTDNFEALIKSLMSSKAVSILTSSIIESDMFKKYAADLSYVPIANYPEAEIIAAYKNFADIKLRDRIHMIISSIKKQRLDL